ncbi:MAG: SigE family RNA polymerase sigma factor [Actinomycetota bacterium]|nr:SigE family RNA polymerase sigma factor [Actinomycetota bacterium]
MLIEHEAEHTVPQRPDFESFYAATARRTVALAYALTGNWGDAEDLVQDAFSAAHDEWDKVSAYDEPSAWVRRLVLNRSVSRWRRLQREAAAVVRIGARTTSAAPVTDPVDPQFWSAMRRLPPQQARAVALFYVDDLSVEQIADHLQCSTGSVKTHLSRARATLAARLGMEDEGHE